MKPVISRKVRGLALPLALAIAAIALYIILKATGIIAVTCPAHYLNPWQYFFHCLMFNLLVYLGIGIPAFLIAFFAIKKTRFSD